MKRIQITTALLALALAAPGCSGSSGGTPPPPPTNTIGGAVSGAEVAGVSVTLVGPSGGITATAADGTYSFPGLEAGSYTVTPSLAGHDFSPASRNVTVGGADVVGLDFTSTPAPPPTFTIGGTVSGAVVAGVSVTLLGSSSAIATTAADGTYGFPGLEAGLYTVTAELEGYAFTPASEQVVLTDADVGGVDFAGEDVEFVIGGFVSGDAVAGVSVALGGDSSAITTTAPDGSYGFAGLANGSYTVTPSLHGHDFGPASRNVTVSGADVAGQDFTSTANPDRDGDGVPNEQDSFPDDPAHFAGYETVLLDRLDGGRFGTAVAVNGSDEVVGLSEDAGGDLKAVMWAAAGGVASAPLQLDPLGAGSYSAAYGVEDDGVVVGESAKGSDVVAVAWPVGSVTPVELSLAGFEPPAAAYGISGSRIVGEAFAAGEAVAVLWSGLGADPVELGMGGLASSAAYAISEAGFVVGEGVVAATGETRGVLWVLDASGVPGPPVLLPPLSGHVAGIALGVSAAGEIAGESESASGEIHGVLWRLAGGVPDPPIDLGIATASAVNGSSRVVGSTASPARASAWDVRNTSLVDPILPDTFTVSQAYGLNESNVAVGRADDRGFVAIPR
jgi:uncharacterized membrane protein